MIVEKVKVDGSGKGQNGWFPLQAANVSYDHSLNTSLEHTLNIDFVNEAQGLGARVAVELSAIHPRKRKDAIILALLL